MRHFAQALRPGAYLRVVEEGTVAAGDDAIVLARPTHDLSVAELAKIYFFERKRARELLDVPELPDGWRAWASEHAS